MCHRVEPLVDGAVKLGLSAGDHVPHRLDAHRGLCLQPGKFEQLLVGGLRFAPAQRPHGYDSQHNHGDKPRKRDGDEKQEMVGHPHHSIAIRRMRTKYERQINGIRDISRGALRRSCRSPRCVAH